MYMKTIDYSTYHFSIPEYLGYGGIYFLLLILISLLFYNSLIPVLFFSPFLFFYFKKLRSYLCERRKKELVVQFRDMIRAMSVSLNSGYSIENALMESAQELASLYGTSSLLCQELFLMKKRLALNLPVEELFSEFAARCCCDDISMFAQILSIAKHSGGNFISIIQSSVDTISEKIQLQRDIEVSIASKRFEQNLMSFMPLLIMTYLRLTSPGFFDSIYGNLTGVLIMSFCLLLYLIAVILGLKISGITNYTNL